MEDEMQLQDSTTPDETLDDLNNSVENGEQPDIEKLIETNKRLYARAKKAEEETKQLREKPKSDEAPKATQDSGLPVRTVLELRKDGYSDAEILELEDESKKLNVPVSTLLSNDLFKKGLEAKRREAKIAQGTPTPSSRSGFFSEKGKSFSEMSADERRATFNARMAGNSRSSE